MKIKTFFIIYPLLLFLELMLVGITHHPTIPLVKMAALTAVVLHQLPWYAYIYLLAGISLSSFLQGFSVPLDLLLMLLVIIAMTGYLHNLLVRHTVAQSAIIAFLTLFFMIIDCFYCLTISNILVTILIIPLMLKFLR